MERKKHIFSCLEKKCFQEIIKEHSSVIENKETDGATLRKKNETWEKITAQYNASPHTYTQVTVKQLRRLWMNLKQRQREALRNERWNYIGTGNSPIKDESVDQDVSQAATALIVNINTASDSDSVLDIKETTSETYVEDMPLSETYEGLSPSTSSQGYNGIPPTRLYPSSNTCHCQKDKIMEKEYKDRQIRANEKHKLELLILEEQLRESKAKADLVEFVLKQKQQQNDPD